MRPVFIVYYLWWSANHWDDLLGRGYPKARRPSPLPATLDARGCTARSLFPGSKLSDVHPAQGYDQDAPGVIERDVRQAAATGAKGFSVNWKGDGTAAQTPSSVRFNRRLQALFDAVHKVNAEGIDFKLQLNYQASARQLPFTQFRNDLGYFLKRYGGDPALDHTWSPKPTMIWTGSWKYSAARLAEVARAFRGRVLLIGDEKPRTWSAARAASLDGASWYWSSQDPAGNPQSFDQVARFAAQVRGSARNPGGGTKVWLAPFAPGYDSRLRYGSSSCVPRGDGRTLRALLAGNARSNPDGWTLISWNEIAEGTYIVPLTRYGTRYTDELRRLLRG